MTVPLRAALYLRLDGAAGRARSLHPGAPPPAYLRAEQTRSRDRVAAERLYERDEVADNEDRIMGSKGDLLRTLAAASGVKSAAGGVSSFVPKWRI